MTGQAERTLLFPCAPEAGESLFGFVARVAAANQLDSARPLLEAAGLSYGPGWMIGEFGLAEAAALAPLLSVETDELARMYTNQARNIVVDGIRIIPTMFFPYRRVSPAGLRHSNHHRRAWQIRQLPFCGESWDVLIENCPECRAPLKWSPTPGVELCQRCGFDLRRAVTIQVEQSDREPLAILAGLLSADHQRREESRSRLPGEVRELRSDDLLVLAVFMGAAMLSPDTRDHMNKAKRCRSVADGVRRLLDPRGPFSIWFDGDLNTPQAGPLLRIRRDVQVNGSRDLQAFVDRLLGDRHGVRRLRDLRLSQHRLTLTEAAAALRLERGLLRRILDAAFPAPAPIRGEQRKLQWVDPAQVELLRQRLANCVSESAFTREFGVTATAVEQLKLANLIDTNFDRAVQLAFEAPALTAESVGRFRTKLRERLRPNADPGWITVRSAFLAVGGRQKPWAELIGGILDGSIPAGRSAAAEAKLSLLDLLVPAACRRMLHEGRFESRCRVISRTESEQHLNCYPRDLDQVGLSWRTGDGPKQGYDREMVEAFGRDYISMREIFARVEEPGRAWALLQQNGLARERGVFWRRADVERLLRPSDAAGGGETFTSAAVHGLGAKTAFLREAAQLSVHTVAEITGISTSRISSMEKGEVAVTGPTLAALATALDTTRSDLTRPAARSDAVARLVDRLLSPHAQLWESSSGAESQCGPLTG